MALPHVVGEEQENERQEGGEDHDHVERLLELARERLELQRVGARVELEEGGVRRLRGDKRPADEGQGDDIDGVGARRVPEHAGAGRVEGRDAGVGAPAEYPAHERVLHAGRGRDGRRTVAADARDARPQGGVHVGAAEVRDKRAGGRPGDRSEQQQGSNPHVHGRGLLYIAGAANVIPSFVLQLGVVVAARAEVVVAAVRRVVHDADVLLGRVVEVVPIQREQHGGQKHGNHGQQRGEQDAVPREPLEGAVEDRRARHVPAQVRVLEEVRERGEPRVAARVGLDLVAEVGVELHVGVELRLLALLAQPRLLAAALVFAVEGLGEHLDAGHEEADAREHDGARGHKREGPLHNIRSAMARVTKHAGEVVINYIISTVTTVQR